MSKKNQFIILLLLVLADMLFFTSCEDTIDPIQYGDVKGIVLGAENEKPIVNASITTKPPTEAIVTDSSGNFILDNIPVGNYTITVKKSGYKQENITVVVRPDETTDVTAFLEKDSGVFGNASIVNPVPANESLQQTVSVKMAWSPTGIKAKDSVVYDVVLIPADSVKKQLVANNISDTTVTVKNLYYNTVYYWQVIAEDTKGNTLKSPVWTFRTGFAPDNIVVFARNLGANYEIFSSDTAAESTRRLTNLNSREWVPRISPNSDLIAFTSNAAVETHLYTMTPEGKNIKRVSTLSVDGYHNNGLGYCWSPDGGEFLFSHYQTLYKISRNGFNRTAIVTAPTNRHWRECDWTAQNGEKVVALAIGQNVYDAEIYLMNPDGSNMTLLVDNEAGMMASPTFSVDGKKVMFTRDVSGFESALGDGRQLDSHIMILNLETGVITDISQNKPAGTNDLFPRFSPNGAKVIFVNASNDNKEKQNIYVMDVDGKKRTLIIEDGTTPSWE